ncbi:hypothetical protein NQ314_021169 [Rhamnusium bicolor]|uniref:Uncharacterized protein n=1 Tax=Rhamnusium bicolor TaxID=1586634 RepID=A0AAV8WJR1_9CUCU|nr:hypothetical protein NQ314_021169 [Rhamnusium bicolor]
MKKKDPEEFFKHTRMDRHIYDLLLSQTKDHLTKKSIRRPINFECRLVSVARSFPSVFGLELSYGKINSQRNNIRDLHNSMGAYIALHNFIIANSQTSLYCPVNYVDGEDTDGMVHLGEWRNETDPLRQARFGSNNSTRNAFHLRESYFLAEGAVPFQYNRI